MVQTGEECLLVTAKEDKVQVYYPLLLIPKGEEALHY
jgi:hypothetical protein